MPAYSCPCGGTKCVAIAAPLDADGGLALCHGCNERVALVPEVPL